MGEEGGGGRRRQHGPVTAQACKNCKSGIEATGMPFSSPSPRKRERSRMLCAQRVGILDHIGSAAGRGAGGKQYKAGGGEHPGGEIAPHRKIVRDVLGGCIAQASQRDM